MPRTEIVNSALPVKPFPEVGWWVAHLHGQPCSAGVPYQKSAHPNRYDIATASGRLTLSVPLAGGRDQQRCTLANLRIAYAEDWQKRHWRSIRSGYGRAPFWEHYAEELHALLMQREERFADFALATIAWCRKALGLQESDASGVQPPAILPVYYQVFEDRHGFLENLSVLDLIMNEGRRAPALFCA